MFKFRIQISLLFFLMASLAHAVPSHWDQQRLQFQAAHALLLKGDIAGYSETAKGLEGYPLYPYLKYVYLSANLNSADADQVQAYLRQFPNSPSADQLQGKWLNWLAQRQDWNAYVNAYTPQKSTVLRCHYAYALLQTQADPEAAWGEAKALWLVGTSQPKECDPLFEAFNKSPLMDEALVAQRVRLAHRNGEMRLAAYLAKRLKHPPHLESVRAWDEMHRNPAAALSRYAQADDDAGRELLLHGLKRLAAKDAAEARHWWRTLGPRYSLDAEARGQLERGIALQAAWQNLAEAAQWLAELDPEHADESVRLVRVQLALQAQDWAALAAVIDSFPPSERNHYQWRYWQARALEQTGKAERARELYQALAQVRDYYGFLAADRLQQRYAIVDSPVRVQPEEELALLQKYPGLVWAREFYFLGMVVEARREWVHVISQLQRRELEIAAYLARHWGWYERAIFTAAKANAYDDLDMRFPLLYRDLVQAGATAQGIDLAWIYGVIRQESAFSADVRSSAGALGLMQIMPDTGKAVAAKLGLSLGVPARDLIDPELNISLGSAYLRQLLNAFGGNYMLATAAYNAGPTRVKRWAEQRNCIDADVWAELVPYRETRGYIRRVLEYTVIYAHRLQLPAERLRLSAVSGPACADAAQPSAVTAGAVD